MRKQRQCSGKNGYIHDTRGGAYQELLEDASVRVLRGRDGGMFRRALSWKQTARMRLSEPHATSA